MIHNDVLNQLQLLIKTAAPPLLEVSQQPLSEPQWVPGQQLQALVIANLPNGRFQVQVADQTLDMNLPKNTQTGETIELRYVGNQPRLTFVLASDLAQASPAARPPVNLSDAARFLGALLEKTAQPETSGTSPLVKTAPLISSAPTDIPKLAQTLRTAISQSGLFYESHQAQWVAGERPLAQLLQEPQAQLSSQALLQHVAAAVEMAQASPAPAMQNNSPAATQNNVSAATQSNAPDLHAAVKNNSPDMPSATQNNSPPIAVTDQKLSGQSIGQNYAATSTATAAAEPVHPHALPLVQQQLEVLDTRQLAWQGQVWPGQNMDWRIEERPAREGEAAAQTEWQTSLNLKLPRLGDVAATLQLNRQGIRIDLRAADAATVERMRAAQADLQQSMQTAGLQLFNISVERNGQG